MVDFPTYYKDVRFIDTQGKVHEGYLEPPFSADDNAFFFEKDSDDISQGIGGVFFHPDDIVSWEYIQK